MGANVSRQLKWQQRQIEEGNCRLCGTPAIFRGYCLDCTIARRESARKKNGYKRRYNSASYRLMAKNLLLADTPDLVRRFQLGLNQLDVVEKERLEPV
jgi:hypothetical protein